MKPAMSFRAFRARSGEAPQDLRHLILGAARNLFPSFRAKRKIGSSAVVAPMSNRQTTRSLTPFGMTGIAAILVGLSSTLSVSAATAQSAQPWNGAGIPAPQVAAKTAGVSAVRMVGLTVSDMDRSVDFYTRALDFTKASDAEVSGPEYETLDGVPGARLRVVRLRLGDELLQLTQYLTPSGQPFPADSRSNDRWFQHVAIIVSDMDRAYARLRQLKVQAASTAPQLLPRTIPNAAGIRAFYFRDPDDHYLEILQFPPDKGDPKWQQTGERSIPGDRSHRNSHPPDNSEPWPSTAMRSASGWRARV